MEKPELKSEELKTEEWLRVFESLGTSPFWVTISGGEPFTRNDLVEICRAICEVNKPKILNIPTNGLLCDRIENWTPKIAETCADNGVALNVNLSLDGIGARHSEIRGVKRNWELAMKTLLALRRLENECHSLNVGVHTVISKYNIHELSEVAAYIVNELRPSNYIMEVAEERSELFNVSSGITPQPTELEQVLTEVARCLRAAPRSKELSKIGLAFRLRYYELIPKILESERQMVPCMASFASCHVSAYGDVWPCCVLGYTKSMGNLGESGFNFQKLWCSERANEVRDVIRKGSCSCPLANAHYTNMLFNFKELFRVMRNL